MNDKANVGRSQSFRSVRTSKRKSVVNYNIVEEKLELDVLMELASKKFECPFKIIVNKEAISDDFVKFLKQGSGSKQKRMRAAPAFKPAITADSENDTNETASTSIEEEAIAISASYDNLNRLAEISINKVRVPRLLMQMLGLIVPHYQQLTRLVLKRCRISCYAIHEMSKFLPLTTITDICLDDSPVPQGNYALLLENTSRLAGLSLCRCMINDEVCKQLANKLQFLHSTETTLSSLNLSSNHITDVGAKYLGEALRSNRNLRYLNLADNRIGDEGANHIFNALTVFPLTYDEIIAKRQRRVAYFKEKNTLYTKCLTQWDSKSLDDFSIISKKSSKKSVLVRASLKNRAKEDKLKGSSTSKDASLKNRAKKDKLKGSSASNNFAQDKAEMIYNEIMGPFLDPYHPGLTKLVNGYCHCVGNMVLCYLNLRYNNLSYASLRKLKQVLFYQSVRKTINQSGLIKVLVEGNELPFYSSEMERINEMLDRNLITNSTKYVSNKLKARARTSVVK